MNVIASSALECSDVKAGRARGDTCQLGYSFALRTWWPVKRAHDAVPCIRRERYRTLSHRVVARDGPVMDQHALRVSKLLGNTAHFKNNSQKINELGHRPWESGIIGGKGRDASAAPQPGQAWSVAAALT
jgi:hypothetical protein